MVIDNTKPVTQKTLLDTLMDFYEKVLGPEFDKINNKLEDHDKRFDGLEKNATDLKGDMREIKQDIRDLKADLPSQKDTDSLKKRVTILEQN